jgi:uncharacterized small protein (DUF1192 family)
LIGKESPKEALPALAVIVFTNLLDLYNINEISLTALAILKDEIDEIDAVDSKNKSTKKMNKDLKKRFDTTLGSVENRLKQINDKDASKKEDPGEFTFYG